jgi:hypothetical protein
MATTGVFTTTGQSSPRGITGGFNMSLWGSFTGMVQIERSFDDGTTWLPLTALGTAISFTGPCSEVLEEPAFGALYRLNCTALTSGTINYRIGQ